MTRDEFSKLNKYDFLEKNNNLYVILVRIIYFVAASENDRCECTKIEFLKEFSISSLLPLDNGFYEYNGKLSRVCFDYETVSIFISQKHKDFYLPISKQTLNDLFTTTVTEEINSILNIMPGGRPLL